MWFPQRGKKWNTVQLSSSSLCHCLIFTDFIQSSITPFFTSLAEKIIKRCSCMGKVKVLLPIRLCIFLMRAMLMIYVRQKKFCLCKLWGHRAVGLSRNFLDIYQFRSWISNKTAALAVLQEWWDLFSMTNNYQLCWEDNITTQHAVDPHERSMVLSFKTFCLTAIEAHHPDLRLVDSCECKNRDKNHLSQTLAHHKIYKTYQINFISCVVERNRMFKPIFYRQNHEKETCSKLWPS